ncbi:sister chromatid cohesion protein PDS5 homolog B isoform X2 [Malania oleifera]|uniref:sister chromatid cohesion protein PDS5 homolog B isoform X2 n=1 Tax=Malania oleifera TaxID=397392 RepID=UPI0025AEAFDB|nr:sister chromatid cohesion protein PDS5 homolog B isoform X2 [Malania oleifera]
MGVSPAQLVSDIGNRLAQDSRPNKDFLVKSLRQAASALSELDQSSSLKSAIRPLSASLVKRVLLQHKDKDVRLLMAICLSEIIRILAPEPPFSDNILRDIFKLIACVFSELADTTSPYFSRRVKILETIAELKFCFQMLDIGCDDLVLEMFNIFFSVVREHHPQGVINAILSIMTLILKEEVSQPLLEVIFRNLLKEGKGAPPASSHLAISVIKNCTEELEPFVRGFLTSCILDKDAVGSELKDFYHEIIFEIFQCAPQMLLAVIPNLTQELLTEQVDVRIKAVNLIEVRLNALQCANACYMANPSGTKSLEVLTALEGRLLDFDDRVRTQAVTIACDLVRSNLKYVPPDLISRAAERLRDKKISVRKNALQKLLEVYRDYCTMCSEGHMTISDHFEQIPCRILMLCYDKDCKEFRPQNLEFVLSEELFPPSLSVMERTRHWIYLFLLFNPAHMKALNSILSQKRRLQTEMQNYLALRKKEKLLQESGSEKVQNLIKTSLKKMSVSFPDPCAAEECFHKLTQVKDNNLFNALAQLLDEPKIINAGNIRDKFVKMIGDKHPQSDFLRSLSIKCSFSIFNSEHVSCVLDHICGGRFEDKHLEAPSFSILLVIVSVFPSLLRDSEKQFQELLEENPFNEKLIQILAKVGSYTSIKLSDIYPSLERVCLEGTRAQSKLAISAIAGLGSGSEQSVFSELFEKVVIYLHAGKNIPTILQSLGCIAQHSVLAFHMRDQEITQYIKEKIFQVNNVEQSFDLASFGESSCKLKIYALKTLVKSFLPYQGTPDRCQVMVLLEILSNMLKKGDVFDGTISCETDEANIKLAAAKSVLRLSRRWDFHISPKIFHSTVLMAKYSMPFVRRLFLDKTHKLLRERAMPSKYACAFALAASDSLKDLQNDSLKYMAEFIRERGKEARIHHSSGKQGEPITDYPAYIVVYLIHVLAHDKGFPAENCMDEEIYAQFCSPLFFALWALVNSSSVDGDVDLVKDNASHLLIIFRAIKRAEDAVNSLSTTKLHVLADIGIAIVHSLNHYGIPSSHAPGVILLPSSLYRNDLSKTSGEDSSRCSTQSATDESFVKGVVNILELRLSQPTSTIVKRGRNCQGDSLQVDVASYRTLNSSLCKKINLSMNETQEEGKNEFARGTASHNSMQQGISTKGRRKKVPFPSAPGSIGLHNSSSMLFERRNGTSVNSELVLEKEQLQSSCDSVTTMPSLMESQVLSQKFDLTSSSSLKENSGPRKCSKNTNDHSKCGGAECKNCCRSKETIEKNAASVGQQIKLLSPGDNSFYSGAEGFDSQNNTHKDAVFAETSKKFCSLHRDPLENSSFSSQEENIHIFGDDIPQEQQQQQKTLPNEGRNFSNRKIPLPAKGKKGLRVSVDASLSEVVNTNDVIARRTRSRKV